MVGKSIKTKRPGLKSGYCSKKVLIITTPRKVAIHDSNVIGSDSAYTRNFSIRKLYHGSIILTMTLSFYRMGHRYIVFNKFFSPSFSNKSPGISEINSDGALMLRDPKMVRKFAKDKNNFSLARVMAT